jgi:hypothetical protein
MSSQVAFAKYFAPGAVVKRSSHKGATIKSYSILEKFDHLCAWRDSTLSQTQYAKQNNIPAAMCVCSYVGMSVNT